MSQVQSSRTTHTSPEGAHPARDVDAVPATTPQHAAAHHVPHPPMVIADPGALGTAGFALTTFVLSTFNSGLLPAALEPVVLGLALFYGGAVQVIAGVIEFFKNNTFGALVFSSYGAFWISFWYYVTFIVKGLPADGAHLATGLFLLAWTIFTAYVTIASAAVHKVMLLTFVLLLATFVCLTVGALAAMPAITHIGGYLGLATAFAAWYMSAASVISSTFGRPVLPLGKK